MFLAEPKTMFCGTLRFRGTIFEKHWCKQWYLITSSRYNVVKQYDNNLCYYDNIVKWRDDILQLIQHRRIPWEDTQNGEAQLCVRIFDVRLLLRNFANMTSLCVTKPRHVWSDILILCSWCGVIKMKQTALTVMSELFIFRRLFMVTKMGC